MSLFKIILISHEGINMYLQFLRKWITSINNNSKFAFMLSYSLPFYTHFLLVLCTKLYFLLKFKQTRNFFQETCSHFISCLSAFKYQSFLAKSCREDFCSLVSEWLIVCLTPCQHLYGVLRGFQFYEFSLIVYCTHISELEEFKLVGSSWEFRGHLELSLDGRKEAVQLTEVLCELSLFGIWLSEIVYK